MRRGAWAIIALLLELAAGQAAAAKAEPAGHAASAGAAAKAQSAGQFAAAKAQSAGYSAAGAGQGAMASAAAKAVPAGRAAGVAGETKAGPAGVSYACLAIAQGSPADEVLAPASGRNLASFYYTKDAQGYLWRLASVNLSADEDNANIRLIEFRVIAAAHKPGIAQFSLDGGALALAVNKDHNIYLTLTLPAIAIKYRCLTN